MRRRLVHMLLVSMLVLTLALGALVAGVSADGELFHTVKWGETLGWIAWRYGVPMSELAEANSIKNTHWVYAGQKLLIPGDHSDYVEHVVKPGESLLTIAANYGVKVWDIARRNGLWNINLIYVGQKLAIPGGASPAPEIPVAEAPPNTEAIIISMPGRDAAISSPVTVKGWGYSSDNRLGVEVLDQDGNVLGQTFVKITADLNQTGPFEGEVEFTAPATAQLGRILVFAFHPRDGAYEHLASVEVMLQP